MCRSRYDAAGLRVLAWLLRQPWLRPVAERGYEWFAHNRLRLTGRAQTQHSCDDGRCAVAEAPSRTQQRRGQPLSGRLRSALRR